MCCLCNDTASKLMELQLLGLMFLMIKNCAVFSLEIDEFIVMKRSNISSLFILIIKG